VLVVIDALDECGTEQERNELLEAIAKDFTESTQFCQGLVTVDLNAISALDLVSFVSKNINKSQGRR